MTKEEARLLIEKYDEGLTSNMEERALRHFFEEQSQEELPEEWRMYKALFAFVDKESVKAITDDDVVGSVVKGNSHIGTIRARVMILSAACLAATVIVMATLAISANNESHRDYAVIDGKVVTDQHLIAAEAEVALQNVAYNENDAFSAFGDL